MLPPAIYKIEIRFREKLLISQMLLLVVIDSLQKTQELKG